MMKFILPYIVSIPIFFIIDMLWLGVIARGLYRSQMGSLMSPHVNWAAAFVFYFLFLAGVTFFAIEPALQKNSVYAALLYGAFFGCVCYATYDLTNLAVIRDWPLPLTLVDMLWGTVLTAMVSGLTFVVVRFLHGAT